MIAPLLLAGLTASLSVTTEHETFARSRAVRAEFQRLNPCPANGRQRGPCPGWEADHIEALVCGGRDDVANMQWLTVQEHRQKTRVEVKLCRRRK